MIAVLFIIILFLVVFWHRLVTFLNLRYQSDEDRFVEANAFINLPKDVHDKAWNKSKNEFSKSWIYEFLCLALAAVFIYSGAFAILEEIAVLLTPKHDLWNLLEGSIFFGLLLLLVFFLLESGALYQYFKDHKKIIFSKPAIQDVLLKMFGVYVFILSLYFLFSIIFYYFSDLWLLGLVLFFCVTIVLMSLLIPVLKVRGLEKIPLDTSSEIYQRTMSFCERHGISSIKIYQVKAPLKRSRSGAYVMGLFKKEIILYDTLFQHLSVDEIFSIILHELGHVKWKHLWCKILINLTLMVAVLWLVSMIALHPSAAIDFGFSGSKNYIDVLLIAMFYGAICSFSNIIAYTYTRMQERQADRYSYQHLPGPYLGDALIKLSAVIFEQVTFCHPLYSLTKNDHPTVLERVMALSRDRTKYLGSEGRESS